MSTPTVLVEKFAKAVVAQDRCVEQGDARTGNRHARVYIDAAKELLAGGEASIEAFSTLLNDPNPSVRIMAAAFLLKSRTDHAVAALRPIADGRGIAALGAQMTLARNERGELEIS